MHPTIYDTKYANKPEEDVWKDLAFKPIPKIKQIIASRSAYTILDYDGNIYKWGNDGSGSIAWGWDYDSKYDNTGNKYDGLYDKYTYEVMYMRGAPTVDPISVDVEKSLEKIYQTPNSTKSDLVTIDIEIPALVYNAAMNITVKPELQEIKYVFIPYDLTNADFNLEEFTEEDFQRAYDSELYKTGSLLNSTIEATDTVQNITKSFEVNGNGKVWIMAKDKAYGRVLYHKNIYLSDNFYTPVSIKHEGIGQAANSDDVIIYDRTNDNVSKIKANGDTSNEFGIPLDANGNVISNPTFGYDKVQVSKYTTLPNGLDDYWTFKTLQTAAMEYVLNDVKFIINPDYVHNFYYERDSQNWITLTYKSQDLGTGGQVAGFTMLNNPEVVEKNIEITRTPPEISDYELVGYKVDNDDTVYDLDFYGDLVYTPVADTTITFLYGSRSIEAGKTVTDSTGDQIASPGEVLTYTLYLKNNGSVSEKDVLIKDTLSTVLAHVDSPDNNLVTVNNGGTVSTKTVQDLITGFIIAEIRPDETVTISFNVTVKSDLDVETVTQIVNQATLGKEIPEITIPTGKVILVSNKLAEDESGDGVASPGEAISYTITSTNQGNATAANLLVQDSLSTVLPYISDPSANMVVVDINGIILIKTVQDLINGFQIAELKPGETASVTFKVVLKSDLDVEDVEYIINQATIGNTIPEVTIPTGEVNLISDKAVVDANQDEIASLGEVLTYTITSTNEGLATAKDVKIQDTLETVIPYVKDTASTIVNVDAAGTVTKKTIHELIA